MSGDLGPGKVGCLQVSRFPLACELAERPELQDHPAVVAREAGVWAASPAAERQGVVAGQPLREALGHCPTLAVFEGRPAHYAAQAEAILTALETVAHGVEPGVEGVAYVDLRGPVDCYPSHQAMYDGLLGCTPAALEPRLGVAPSKFTALVAAHQAEPGGSRVVTTAEVTAFLSHQPVELLPVSMEMLHRLRLLGIVTLGALAALPRTALTAQFGTEGAEAWYLARGDDRAPVRPRPWRERIVERLSFLTPLIGRDAVLAAAEQALNRVLRQPVLRGRATRQATLRVETERGTCWERVFTFQEALAERDHLWRVLRSVLIEAQLPGPVSELFLELTGLTPLRGWQLELLPARGQRRDQLEECLRQLKARYGYCPVSRVVEVEPWSRIPERRLALIDFDP